MKCKKCWIAAALLCAAMACTALTGCFGGEPAETTPAVSAVSSEAETDSTESKPAQSSTETSSAETSSTEGTKQEETTAASQKPSGGESSGSKTETPAVKQEKPAASGTAVNQGLAGTYAWYSIEYNDEVYTLEEMVQELTKEHNVFGLEQISDNNKNAALSQARNDCLILYEDGSAELRLNFLLDGSAVLIWELNGSNLFLQDLSGLSTMVAWVDGNELTLTLSQDSGTFVLKFRK